MSSKQARAKQKMNITVLMGVTSNGGVVQFDISKVKLVDAETGSVILAPKETK